MRDFIYLIEYIGFQNTEYTLAKWYKLNEYSILLSEDYIAIYKDKYLIYSKNGNVDWLEEKSNLEKTFCIILRKQKIYDLLNGRM